MAKEHVYLAPGANVESTDTFASWIESTNLLITDMGTVVLTSVNQPIPNTSVGGITTGNSHIEGIFGANTFAAGTALRGGSVNAVGNLNITSNTIFANSNIVTIGTNTNIFTVSGNNSVFTSNVAINNAAKVFTVTAANTQFNAGTVYLKANTSFTGTRFDLDGTDFDITANTSLNAAVLNANAATTTVGFTGANLLTVNSRSVFAANATVNGIFASTANALFTGAQAQFDNNVILGSSVADSLSVNAYLITDLLPTDTTVDLGTDAKPYGNVHTTYVWADNNIDTLGELHIRGAAARVLKSKSTNTSYQDLRLTLETSTGANTTPIVANSSSVSPGANTTFDLGATLNMWRFGYMKDLVVANTGTITGDLGVNGGNFTTSAATFNLVNAGATTINFGGAATAWTIGAATGTMTFRNPTLVSSNTTVNLFNTTSTTANILGAATTITLGAVTGTTTIRNNGVVGLDLAVNGGNLTTSAATFNLINAVPTTVNFAGAATTLNIGGAGTTTIKSPTIVSANTILTLFNTQSTNITAFGAATTLTLGNATGAQTLTIGGASTAAATYNLGTGVTPVATTKTLNLATGGAGGSTTDVNIGSVNGGTTAIASPTITGGAGTVTFMNAGTTTFTALGAATAITFGANTGITTLRNPTIVGSNTTVNLWNTVSTIVNAFGDAATLNIGTGAAASTLIFGSATANNTLVLNGGGTPGTVTVTSNVTTGNFTLAPSVTSGNVNVGSANTSGKVKVLFGTPSSNTTDGAFIVTGGAGIGGNLNVGGALVVTGTTNLVGNVVVDGTFTLTGGNVVISSDTGGFNALTVYDTFEMNSAVVTSEFVPGANTTYDLGTSVLRWRTLFGNNAILNAATITDIAANNVSVANGAKDGIKLISGPNGTIGRFITITPPASVTANSTVTLANANTTLTGGTMATTEGKISQFAATTSAELISKITDNTGTGALVFGTSATLSAPSVTSGLTLSGTLTLNGATSGTVALSAPAIAGTRTIAFPALSGTVALISDLANGSLSVTSSDGISGSGTFTANQGTNTAIAFTNTDKGSSQNIFKVVANNTGVAQFTAASNSDTLRVAASGIATVTFGASNTLTIGAVETTTLQNATGRGATSTDVITLTNTTDSTSASTGALKLSGGVGILKALNVGGIIAALDLTESTSTSTGALKVSGGVGIAKNLYVGGNAVISGNLTINGATTTINASTLAVEDKNIEMGAVTTPSNVTADGGGITLKGTTDKTINWINSTAAWTLSENVDLATTKVFRIAGTQVLSATALGTGVLASSLTSVGTISSGTWQGTTIAVNQGGTGQTTFTNGQLLIGNTTGNTLTKATLTAGNNVIITNSTGSITIAAANTNITYSANTTTVLIGSSTGADAIILGANSTVAGIVTTGAQTFLGAKTFTNGIVGAVTGNASTATTAAALTTARTIAISGGVTGTATSFNGSANITIPITAMDASALSTGTLADARLSGTYSGITSLTSTSFFAGIGTPAAPAISFSTDTDSGLYSVGGNQVGLARAGVRSKLWNGTGEYIFTLDTPPIFRLRRDYTTTSANNGVTGYIDWEDLDTADAVNVGGRMFTQLLDNTIGATNNLFSIQIRNSGSLQTHLTLRDGYASLPVGTEALPGINFIGDTDTGMWRSAANQLQLVTGGVARLTANATGIHGVGTGLTALDASQLTTGSLPDARISGSYTGMVNLTGTGTVDFAKFAGNPGDTAALPSYTFTGDTNTGMYSPAADQIAWSTGGVVRLTANSTGIHGVGTGLTALNASNLTSGTVASARLAYASQAEAEAGVNALTVMNPLRTAQAIAALATSGWNVISDAAYTSVTEAEFILNTTNYSAYKLIVENIRPSIDAASFRMQLSNNSGSSYFSTSGDYLWAFRDEFSNSGTQNGNSSTTSDHIRLAGFNTNLVGNAAGEYGYSGEIILPNLTVTGQKSVVFEGAWNEHTGGHFASTRGGGQLAATTTTINAVKIYYNGANISTGRIILLGLKK